MLAENFMIFRLYSLLCSLFVSVLLLCGCSQNVSVLDYRDSVDDTMKRARAKVSEGDTDGAIKLYRKVLNDESLQARAHLDLALLLSDKNDYLDAICHYQRYLAMRPDTEKRGMIEERMQRAIQSFVVAQTPDSSLRATGRGGKQNKGAAVSSNDFATTLQKLKRAEDSEASLISQVAELKKANKRLEGKVDGCESELDQYRAIVGLTPRDTDEPIGKPPPANVEPEEPPDRSPRTYRVRRGDTLSSIATDVYGDEKQWVKIQKANKRMLKGRQRINTGQVLIIP